MAEYTYNQLIQAARNADAAGDAVAAKKLLEAASPLRIMDDVSDEVPETPSDTTPTPPSPVPSSQPLQQSLPKPVGFGMEFVSAVNRGGLNLLDVALSPLRALTISHPADPFSTEKVRQRIGQKGQFAGDGLGTDIAAAAGQLSFDTAVGGAIFRGLSRSVNQLGKVSPTALDNILETMGKTTFADDVAMGFSAGVGGEVAANIEQEWLETSGGSSRLVGQMISPAGWASGVNLIRNASKRYLAQAQPNLNQIKGASTALYQKLDEAGIVASDADTERLLSTLKTKMSDDNMAVDSELNTLLGRLIKAAESNTLSWGLLDKTRSNIRSLASPGSGQKSILSQEYVDVMDDMILTIKPKNPKALPGGDAQAAILDSRNLWRRYKAAETINDAFVNASQSARIDKKNFAEALRSQLKPLVKKDKYNTFTQEQRKMISQVLEGGNKYSIENNLRLLNSLGVKSDDYAKVMLMGSLVGQSSTGTAISLGAMGVSRIAGSIANRIMSKNANTMKSIINAGANGEKIAKIYLQSTPVKDRNPADLTALLLSSSSESAAVLRSLQGSNLKKIDIVSDALALSVSLSQIKEREEAQRQQALQAQMPN